MGFIQLNRLIFCAVLTQTNWKREGGTDKSGRTSKRRSL